MRTLKTILTLSLSLLISNTLIADESKDSTEYHGYWRLGLNTDSTILGEAADSQGEHKIFYDIPTSRHANQPDYFWVQVVKNFDSGTKAVFKIDSEANALPHETGNWDNQIRVRDLYLSMKTGADSSIWVGSRVFEFESIRLFDVINHFDLSAHGAGFEMGGALAALSFAKENIVRYTTAGNPILDGNGDTVTTTRKNTTLLVRHELSLGAKSAVKPMLKVISYGKLPEDKETDATTPRAEVKGSSGYSIGGVFSQWSDTSWANYSLWLESRPVDTTGENTDKDTYIGLSASNSYDLGSFGLLFALWAQQETYQSEKQVYVVEGDVLVQDSDATTKSALKVSIGAQPVYYITQKLHAALDLNVTTKSKKTSQNDFNSTLITPILRYSMQKNPMGVPKIYTSITYGTYDWKAKKQPDGKMDSTLITTQTGFEIWF